MKSIDTKKFSREMRNRGIDLENRRVLITDFRGSAQESDLTVPPNCGGFGRVRHFRRISNDHWPVNPLPIEPVARALGVSGDMLRAQVFQNAVCNWRCWYCYVPFELLSANPEHSAWFTPSELVDLYLSESNPPLLIDLTGGQPDLVPEWIPWTMQALINAGINQRVYLWSDDNLSNDYYFRFLSADTRRFIAEYENYSRVCCFKGFDPASFAFNTNASGALFETQFAHFKRLLAEGLDLYAYVTFTTPYVDGVASAVSKFVDRLQAIHHDLPLRTVPLWIQRFNPVNRRIGTVETTAERNQWIVCSEWSAQLERRFSAYDRSRSVTDVEIRTRG